MKRATVSAEAHTKKHRPIGWCFFDCPQVLLSALLPTARRGECEGGTFDGFPHSRSNTARRRPLLRSKSAAPKRIPHPIGWGILFGAGDEARTRFPASREWHSHSQEPCLTSEFDALRAGRGSEFKPARGFPKTKPHPFGWGFVFGAGDEARTRYLDLGKVALYQMSYARKRKIDYNPAGGICQPLRSAFFSFFSG